MTETWEDDQDRHSSSLATASSFFSEISIISLNLGHVAFTHASQCSQVEDENTLTTELFCTWCDN